MLGSQWIADFLPGRIGQAGAATDCKPGECGWRTYMHDPCTILPLTTAHPHPPFSPAPTLCSARYSSVTQDSSDAGIPAPSFRSLLTLENLDALAQLEKAGGRTDAAGVGAV